MLVNRTKLRPAGCCQWPRIREGFGRITASRPSTCIDSFVTVPRPIQRVTSGLCRAACKRVYSCAYANRIPSRVRRLRPVCVYSVSPPFSLSLLHLPPFYAQPQRANLYTGYHKYEHTAVRYIRWKTLTNFTYAFIKIGNISENLFRLSDIITMQYVLYILPYFYYICILYEFCVSLHPRIPCVHVKMREVKVTSCNKIIAKYKDSETCSLSTKFLNNNY